MVRLVTMTMVSRRVHTQMNQETIDEEAGDEMNPEVDSKDEKIDQ